ncbi:Rv1733c family protein [Acrocarpospora catenulata]|uniref:Rv1733c family protein n=1 Tax=Acrocarpospora catenulata TaxID=2836182 RepID=UPI001BDA1883|nr:hypothetical protein [Acrocarpospora catenulata]
MALKPGSRGPTIRFVRWLGLDRNPLRRRSDRFESAIRLISLLGLLTATVLGVLLGVRVYRDGLRIESQQARTRHQVTATLLETAGPRISVSAPAYAPAMATWRSPDGALMQGVVNAPALRPHGHTVTVWVDDRGAITERPRDRETTLVSALTVGTGIPVLATAFAALLLLLTRALVSRQARHAWAAEWTVIEPTWRIND